MMVFHGTEKEISVLTPGTFVSKRIKDAMKFGYRRAVQKNALYVNIYKAYVPEFDMKKDPNRDGSYILNVTVNANILDIFRTYDVPYKLKNFRMKKK